SSSSCVVVQVVLTDIGCAVLAEPTARHQWDLKKLLVKQALPIGTVQYRAPDIILGSQSFGFDMDIWGLGCVAAELHQRKLLFDGKRERDVWLAQLRLLPPPDHATRQWLQALPLASHFPAAESAASANVATRAESAASANVTTAFDSAAAATAVRADVVHKLLALRPEERLSATAASEHALLQTRPIARVLEGAGKWPRRRHRRPRRRGCFGIYPKRPLRGKRGTGSVSPAISRRTKASSVGRRPGA
ncbi:MAG: hypothetical protein GY701_31645, partial [Sulfitobacter sp.]|nr:hypothetical protein [Sulfitobacter sp.]